MCACVPEEAAVDTDGMTWMDLDDTLRVRAVDEGVSDGSSRQVLYQVLMYPSRTAAGVVSRVLSTDCTVV